MAKPAAIVWFVPAAVVVVLVPAPTEPRSTSTAPLGLIEPWVPALAVIVRWTRSPIAKPLNEVIPVAWVLVAVRVPIVVGVQLGESNLSTWKRLGFAPASTSVATKLKVAE